ncbi:MAG: Rhodanese domain protein [Holophagaceae bacterium]|nr:Rhodanese domain protein [Holophagaceae bacterium]
MRPFEHLQGCILTLLLLGGVPPLVATPPPTETGVPAVPIASFSQTLSGFQEGVLFLDARSPEDYFYGHIPGALNLPIWEKDFEPRLAAFLKSPQADRNKPMIVYCNGCCSTDSLFLAQRLRELGFTGVRTFRDGFRAWARADRPIAGGEAPGPAPTR